MDEVELSGPTVDGEGGPSGDLVSVLDCVVWSRDTTNEVTVEWATEMTEVEHSGGEGPEVED